MTQTHQEISTNELEIFYAIDDAYMVPLMAALAALSEECRGSHFQPVVTVLGKQLSLDNHKKLSEFGAAQFGTGNFVIIGIDYLLPRGLPLKSPHNTYITETAYARFLIPNLVRQHSRMALYLDADTLVKADISGLLKHEFEGKVVAAVRDHIVTSVSHPQGLPNWEELGMPSEQAYFNTGVLLFNLPAWREANCTSRLYEYCDQRGDRLEMFDQEALNAVLSREISSLPHQYNVFTNHLCNETVPGTAPLQRDPLAADVLEEAIVIHFVGHLKPWKPGDTPSAENELFFEALNKSPLRGWQVAGESKSGGSDEVYA